MAIGLRLDRGLSLCEQGEATTGLLWLARILDEAAANGATDFETVIRANIASWAGRITMPQMGPSQRGLMTAMAFTADGRRLLTSRTEVQKGKIGGAEAQVWDLDGWKPIGRPLIDPDAIHFGGVYP